MTEQTSGAGRAVAAAQSNPAVSPLRASIPSADGSNWTRRTVAVWEVWSFGSYRASKRTFDGPWQLHHMGEVIFTTSTLQSAMAHAQTIEDFRAETGDSHD
jgi:hypothetical protein